MEEELKNLLKSAQQNMLSFSEKKNGAKKHCFTCNGHGFPDKVCPECGMQPVSKSLNLDKRPAKANVLLQEAKNVQIPNGYIGVTWSEDILRSTKLDKANDGLFDRFAKQLGKIHSIFMNGNLPNKSALIIAPPQYSKVTFAYSCMQAALDHDFTVAPLLDTLEVKRLLVLAAERPTQVYGSLNYEDYVNSDVMFITVTKTKYREEAYQVIQEMLDKRSRRGLATFFISRYSIETLSKRDWSESFKYILDYNNTENSLKYPAVINYWDHVQRVIKTE